MGNSLGQLLKKLRDRPTGRELDHLEFDVRRRVANRNERIRAFGRAAALRAAVLSLAMITGIMAGGAAATTPRVTERGEMSVFTSKPELAPSTLLEGLP